MLMLHSQTCMDKHQVVGVLRQMEKFLKGQEMRFTEGLRIMKSKLATLQNSVSKLPQADQSAGESKTDNSTHRQHLHHPSHHIHPHNHHHFLQDFFTAVVLTFHSRKGAGVT